MSSPIAGSTINREANMILQNSLINGLVSSFVSFVIMCVSFMIVGLSYRYISIKFGKRIKSSSQKGILITGATSGIGLTLAKHFYKLGFTVFACYFNDQELGYKELKELSCSSEDQENNNAHQPRLFLIQMDVRSQVSIEASSIEINLLLDRYGIELCRLINNAGVSSDGPFEWSSREAIKNVVDTNLVGVMMVTKQFILRIIMSKGRVINVSSVIYMYPANSFSIYGATKSAVAYFSEALHEDIKIYGASCSCIMPGNLMANSNIMLTRLKGLQDSELKLSELEKNVFARSIHRYKKGVNKFVRLRLETCGDNLEQLAAAYGVQLPAFKPKSEVASSKSGFARLVESFFESIDGGTKRKNVDNTGVGEAFEDAACLIDPPRRIYAGNASYSAIAGPISEYIPKVMIGPMVSFLTYLLASIN